MKTPAITALSKPERALFSWTILFITFFVVPLLNTTATSETINDITMAIKKTSAAPNLPPINVMKTGLKLHNPTANTAAKVASIPELLKLFIILLKTVEQNDYQLDQKNTKIKKIKSNHITQKTRSTIRGR